MAGFVKVFAVFEFVEIEEIDGLPDLDFFGTSVGLFQGDDLPSISVDELPLLEVFLAA